MLSGYAYLFSFPVNLIIGIAILALPIWWKFPRKRICALTAIAALTISALTLGFCGRDATERIITSWPFAAVMIWVLTALAGAVIGRCAKIKADRQIVHGDIPFLMMHAGMWLSIFAGYLGSCDNFTTALGTYQPWSGTVTAGIIMMIAGAVTMLPRRKGKEEEKS